jgi:hypothetical protein
MGLTQWCGDQLNGDANEGQMRFSSIETLNRNKEFNSVVIGFVGIGKTERLNAAIPEKEEQRNDDETEKIALLAELSISREKPIRRQLVNVGFR